MKLLRIEKYNDIDIKYYLTEKSGEFNEFGIYVSYGKDDWEVKALSSDLEFMTDLINTLADSLTLPDYVQELCEEALLEQVFIEERRKNEH